MSRQRSFDVPPQTGLMAEAIAVYFLGGNARWIGGRNPGYDIVLDGSKIDVKSGVAKSRRILTPGGPRQDAIGIHLNKGGIPELRNRNVDEILVITRDPSQGDDGSSNRIATARASTKTRGTSVHVTLEADIHGVTVYRIPVADVPKVFDRPYDENGDQLKTLENVEADPVDLTPYRIRPPH